MVDESTDKGQDKNLCVVVCYEYPASKKPRTCLLELVRLDPRDCSAAKLWEATEEAFRRFNIPITNIIGLACDSCSTMVGMNNSYWTRLRAACPWALLLPCVCHSVAKVSEKACSMLPDFVQDHLRSVCTYLSGSPKRSKELYDFQESYDEELKKVIKPSGTRWLVLHRCVEQYIKIQKSLLGFFELRVFEEKKDKTAARILQDLRNPYTLAYMHFLNYALNFTNQFNAIFQSKQVLIHKLAEKSEALMKNICQNFIKPALLPRIGQIDYTRPANQLPLREVYLGPGCREALDRLVPAAPRDASVRPEDMAAQLEREKDAFREKCLEFYARAAQEMKERLPLNELIFKEMAIIDPEVLLSQAARTGSDELSDLPLLTARFEEKLQLDKNALATEWRNFPNEVNGRLREKLLAMSVEDAWVEIGSLKNGLDEPMFPQLCKLASLVKILPHSNADSERVFSVVTDVRTKKRNRLGTDSLNAVCVSRISFRSKGIDCTSFQVTKEHLQRHNKDMYVRK
ncbi:Zinc finger protein 862 [Frankliniella fusca]|uniref:Zinc finger protein 862 n=1 Tax=Frankliniella fusca TaxID=407009 RepID=A0AAE1HAL7_9NEOP|nr:Zinc finger protein 862 [Frankliniella fusca]